MEIRYIKNTDDRLEISSIYEKSWKFAYKGFIPQSYLDSIPSAKWTGNLDNPELHSLIITEDEKIIGTSSFCKSRFSDFAGFGEIVSVYLLPEYIGKGYGKKLFQAVIDELYKFGFRDIFLWVLEDNIRARTFYENAGFLCDNKFLDDNIGGKTLREIQYFYHIE